MSVYLINPSHVSFGVGVITPRWLYVLASATPGEYGTPILVDETLESFDTAPIRAGDIVGVGIHTGNALRGYEIGTAARAAGAWVVFGGIHATLYPDEARDLGGAPAPMYDGGRIEGDEFLPGRWELLPQGKYMWASVQTVRGCPKHCSFCSVWRTDGQRPRQRHVDRVLDEIVSLRRRGFRFIALADDNFYPVTLEDLRMADRRQDKRASTADGDPERAVRADGRPRAAAVRYGVLHADHDGSGRGSGVPRRDAARQHQGRARRRRVGHPRGAEGRLQELQRERRSARRAAPRVPPPRRARARVVHLRAAERSPRDVRHLPLGRRARRPDVCAVRDVDAVSGHARLRRVGEVAGSAGGKRRRHPGDAPLAHSSGVPSEGVHGASGDERRRDPDQHTGRVGPVLFLPQHLEAIERREVDQGQADVRADLEDQIG